MQLAAFFLFFWLHDWVVAPSGGDFSTIQAGLNAAQAGDRVLVRDGVYNEQITFPRSGSSGASRIELLADAGHHPILDGSGFSGGTMVLMENRSHLVLKGFEIRNLAQINDGSGIRILGAGEDIAIEDCTIHHLSGQHAMGVTVYGTQATALSQITIRRVVIADCEPASSEALTLNGNVDGFLVEECTVRDVNNIGIDFIGGETSINPNQSLVARNGICRGNLVERAHSSYGGGYAAGIYVDGGRNIVIEGNTVRECDMGIEIGAENAGLITREIVVRNNWIHHNDKVGLVFGGYDASVGRTEECLFLNNTLYFNDVLNEGLGELWIQWASNNRVENNIFFCLPNQTITYSESGNQNNSLDYNLWYAQGSQEWVWAGSSASSFAAFQNMSGQDGNGLFADPLLVNPASGEGHLHALSPARDSGDPAADPAEVGSQDWDGQVRLQGRLDRGMDEFFNAPVCLGDWLALWRQPTTACGETAMVVPVYIRLLLGACTCGPTPDHWLARPAGNGPVIKGVQPRNTRKEVP